MAQAQNEPVAIPKNILEEFKEDCGKAIEKQFTDSREKEFRIRMSNIGKPLCQLKMEKKYIDSEEITDSGFIGSAKFINNPFEDYKDKEWSSFQAPILSNMILNDSVFQKFLFS